MIACICAEQQSSLGRTALRDSLAKIDAAVGVRSLTPGLLVIREIEDFRGFRGWQSALASSATPTTAASDLQESKRLARPNITTT